MATKTKNKQKASVTAPKTIRATNTISRLISLRLAEITEAMNGVARLRSDRWHGQTSLYDTGRIVSFLSGIDETINMDRFYSLAKEIPTFFQVLGSNLSRAISASL